MKNPDKPPRTKKSRQTAEAELQALRARLEEAEETIEALRRGAVDAVVVSGDTASGHQVFSLSGADQPYRVYVERMQEGAVTVSAEGIVLFCNVRFAEMTGFPLERVIGSAITRYIPDEAWQRLAEVFVDAKTVAKQSVDIFAVGSREPLPVLLTASELPLQDETVMCLVVTDLTVEKENVRLRTAKEFAESASLAKDQFFAALSHELRTPLTPVLMTLSALEADPTLPADVHEDILMMKRNIELETKLVDDLLDLNRIATGKLKLDIQPVDINEAVRQVCAICRSQEDNEDVVFEVEYGADAGSVAADPSRLHQVLWNVLKNAIKFTPEKTVIRILTRKLADGHCEVRIQDQGIGIPAEVLPRIFDAFEQGEASITRQFGGLGLGLAICKAIMELHHGTIRAESEGPGQGATFIMELPAAASAAAAGIKPASGREKEHPGKLRLLVVEDHEDTLHTLGRLLTSAGYLVRGVSSVQAAVDVAARESFDLVLSDLGLPDGDGYQVMRRISTLQKVPGIAMSGYGMEADVQRSRDAGFAEHLTKPVQFAALKRAITRLAPQALPPTNNSAA